VSGTDLGVLAVRGAEEIRLFPLVVVGDAVIQLFSAISAVQQARKRTDKSTFCRSTAMFAIPVDIVFLFALTLINWEFISDLNEVNFVNFPQTTKRAGTQHIKSPGENLSPYL
jgi:hypothetical protein